MEQFDAETQLRIEEWRTHRRTASFGAMAGLAVWALGLLACALAFAGFFHGESMFVPPPVVALFVLAVTYFAAAFLDVATRIRELRQFRLERQLGGVLRTLADSHGLYDDERQPEKALQAGLNQLRNLFRLVAIAVFGCASAGSVLWFFNIAHPARGQFGGAVIAGYAVAVFLPIITAMAVYVVLSNIKDRIRWAKEAAKDAGFDRA